MPLPLPGRPVPDGDATTDGLGAASSLGAFTHRGRLREEDMCCTPSTIQV